MLTNCRKRESAFEEIQYETSPADRFGVPATARASVAMYSTHEEIDALVKALEHARETFAI